MLIHPVGREHQQASHGGLYGYAQLREACLAAFDDIIQIPKQDEVSVGDRIDRIEMQLEALVASRSVLLERQVGMHRCARQRNGQSDISIVAIECRIDAQAEIRHESVVGKARHVQFGPSRILESASHAAPISDLKSRQCIK